MSVTFGNEDYLFDSFGDQNNDCPKGMVGEGCWKSTGDVPVWQWVSIAAALPIVAILGWMHRNGKFKCFGQYDASGVEDRLAWFGTVAVAVFFLIKMFAGPAYFLTIFDD